MKLQQLATLATILATPAAACSPAPSCWTKIPSYLREMCTSAADGRTTLSDLKRIEIDENDPGGTEAFVDACQRLGIAIADRGNSPLAACTATGKVVGLDPNGDNFLSVRRRPSGPSGPSEELDQLFTDEKVCIVSASGRWLNVRYQRNGRMFSGWVYDRYIR